MPMQTHKSRRPHHCSTRVAFLSAIALSFFWPTTRLAASVYEAAPQAEKIDVFLIAGQSNASGVSGDARDSPRVPAGQVLQFYKGRFSDANDPVGNAQPGSAWPAFGMTYQRLTGKRVLFVPAAVPASALTADADTFNVGHWDQSGTLYDEAISKLQSALLAAGAGATFKGVLWSQGEAEGGSVEAGYGPADRYERDLRRLIAHLRSDLGTHTPFFIFETGSSDALNAAGYAKVRAAQEAVSRDVVEAPIVFAGAASFPARGMMNDGGPHYSQAGYNEMGAKGAQAVAAFLSANTSLRQH